MTIEHRLFNNRNRVKLSTGRHLQQSLIFQERWRSSRSGGGFRRSDLRGFADSDAISPRRLDYDGANELPIRSLHLAGVRWRSPWTWENPEQIQSMMKTVIEALGTIDILVNCAGFRSTRRRVDNARDLGQGDRYQPPRHVSLLPGSCPGNAREEEGRDDQLLVDLPGLSE